MAQTLQYRLEQNQVEQRKLNNDASQQLDRAYYKALRWIEKREPELAEALRDSKDHELVFTELCRVYRGKLWTSNENTRRIWLRGSLTAYLFRCWDFFSGQGGVCPNIVAGIVWIILVLQVLVKVVLLLCFASSMGKIGSLLFALYPISIVVRISLSMIVLHYNLTWDAPIYKLYSFQKRHKKQIQALKEREQNLRQSLNLIEKAEIRRFEDNSAWFYRALEEGNK